MPLFILSLNIGLKCLYLLSYCIIRDLQICDMATKFLKIAGYLAIL